MELFELYLSPIDETRFTAIVSQSTASGDGGDTPSALPQDGKRRITLIKTLNCLKFSVDDFQGDGELDWMEDKNIITANRDAFHPDYLPQIGNLLYKTLFPPGSPVEKLLGQAIAHGEYNRNSLVLRLKFAADGVQRSRVADYPWELLHDGQRFLCHHSVKLSRYIAYKGVPPKLPPIEKLNVLLVSSEAFSNEIDLKRLSRKEREAIRRGVEKASEDGHICLRELEVSTFEHLRAYLTEHRGEDSPHVVHFDGHGLFGQKCRECGTIHKTTKRQQCRNCGAQLPEPQGYLVFEDEDGNPDYISAKELGTLLQQFGLSDVPSQAGGVVLVVLSACQSGMAVAGESVFNGAAQNLIAHRVPAVVAMQYSVRVDSATKFAEQFYRSLGQKNSLAVAVSQARAAMGVEGNQWYRPVLYLRWHDNEGGQMFESATLGAIDPQNLSGTGNKRVPDLPQNKRQKPHDKGKNKFIIGGMIFVCIMSLYQLIGRLFPELCTIPPPRVGETAVLVDDLEDGDRFNQFLGTWFTYDDHHMKGPDMKGRDIRGDSQIFSEDGNSDFKASPGGPRESDFAARIRGKVTTTYRKGFLGMGTHLHENKCAVDITKHYNAIQFWAKGDGKSYRMKLRSPLTKGDDFGYNFVADTQWKEYVVEFGQLEQEGSGLKVNRNEALSQVLSINWKTLNQPHDSIELIVDNIRFIKQ